MSILDELLGQGGIDATFSDWDEARNFVIFKTILNNPRFDDTTSIRLQDMEQDAYEATYGKILQTEKSEIAAYFQYLKNNFPSITDDERFLAIYDAAVEVKADQPSVSLDDFEVPEPVIGVGQKVLIYGGVVALAFLLLRD